MRDLPFTPLKIANLELKNRFVMSAAVDGMSADLGARVQRYARLAEGEVGLIIAGRVLDGNESFERAVDAVHERGGRIAVQILSHVGLGFASDGDPPAASVVPRENPIFSRFFPHGSHHEASESEVVRLIDDFAKAARLAKDIGADAVQVHSAHNSALMQFLTPLINRRRDRWGGSIENRTRIHRKVYEAVRLEVGDEMPILIKLGVEDPFPEGLKFGEGKTAAMLMAKYGYDAIEVSQGLQDFRDMNLTPLRTGISDVSKEAYFRDWCREIKMAINKPTIMTGGIRSYELADEMIRNGETNFIGMCRPFIREPGLIRRWRIGDRRKATCTSCNMCGIELMNGRPLACRAKNIRSGGSA